MRSNQAGTSGTGKAAHRRHKASATASRLDCAAAFQRIARDCANAIAAHHSSACAGDEEAVHLIRVAITRLKAAVSFFAPMTADAEWPRLKKEIAWLNGSLGAARDTDVAMDYAGRKRYRSWAQYMIGKDLDQCRTRDHRRLVRCLRSARFRRLIEEMAGWIERGPWIARREQAVRRKPPRPLKAYCAHKLDRWHKRLVRKGRHLATMDESDRHRLRIKAKRFRYMLEALEDIVAVRGAVELRRRHKAARRLQRALGDLRDLSHFGRLGDMPPHQRDEHGSGRPPGYRKQKQKLLEAAIAACRGLEQADAR